MKNTYEQTYRNIPVFLEDWWMQAQAGPNFRFLEWKKGNSKAVWPFEIRKKWGMTILKTPDISPYSGPFFDIPDDLSAANKPKIINEAITYFFDHFPSHHALLMKVHPDNDYFLPFIWQKADVSPRVTYRLPQGINQDEAWKLMKNSNRRNIQKSMGKITVREDDQIDILWDMISKTLGRQGLSPNHTKSKLQDIFQAASEHNCSRLLVASDQDNNPHSASLFIRDGQFVYYYKGGSDPRFRDSEAFSILIWEGIKWAAELNLGFDFEGSMVEPIERFFRSWGSYPVTYYQINRFSNKFLKTLYALQ